MRREREREKGVRKRAERREGERESKKEGKRGKERQWERRDKYIHIIHVKHIHINWLSIGNCWFINER